MSGSPLAARSPSRVRKHAAAAARLLAGALFWCALGALCFAGFGIGRLQCGGDVRGCFRHPLASSSGADSPGDGGAPLRVSQALAVTGEGSFSTVQVPPFLRSSMQTDQLHDSQDPKLLSCGVVPHVTCCIGGGNGCDDQPLRAPLLVD